MLILFWGLLSFVSNWSFAVGHDMDSCGKSWWSWKKALADRRCLWHCMQPVLSLILISHLFSFSVFDVPLFDEEINRWLLCFLWIISDAGPFLASAFSILQNTWRVPTCCCRSSASLCWLLPGQYYLLVVGKSYRTFSVFSCGWNTYSRVTLKILNLKSLKKKEKRTQMVFIRSRWGLILMGCLLFKWNFRYHLVLSVG